MMDSCTAVMPSSAQSVAAMERTAFAACCAEVSQPMKSSDSTTVGDGPRQIHGNLAADKRLKRKQRKLLHVSGTDNSIARGEQAIFVGIIQPHDIFRLVGRCVVQ